MDVPARERVSHRRFLPDAARRPQDGAVDDCVLLHETAMPEHRIWADSRPGPDDGACVEERRALDCRAIFDPHVVAAIDMTSGFTGKWRGLIPAVHDVAVNLRVLLRCSDVDPVAVVFVRDEGLAAFDERREEAAL